VRDESGKPVANAFVIALGGGGLSREHVAELDDRIRSAAGRGAIHSSAVRTDAEGRFSLAHVPVGRDLRPYALHPEHAPLEGSAVALREGAAARIELRFRARRER
jgi:hypothetical protein